MRTSYTVGRMVGIPIRVHLNWFLIASIVTWSLSMGYFPQEYPGWKVHTYWILGLITALFFFASVLMHEFAHAIVASREGVRVRSITLFILGGVAHIAREPETAGSEFRIVVAGPVASLLLAGAFYLCHLASSFSVELAASTRYLSQINVVLAVFNLIPGFPLDGGRILRALFWWLQGDFLRATRWGTNAGLAVAILFALAGLVLMMQRNFFGGAWMGFIGWYLGNAAQESYRQALQLHPVVQAALIDRPTEPSPRYSGD